MLNGVLHCDHRRLISDSECLGIVEKACGRNLRIESFDIVPASNGIVGYLGEYFKLNVIYSTDSEKPRQTSFFVKSLPLNNALHKEEILSKGFMEKERLLYASLFPDMQKYEPYKWHANVYLVRNDLIVFEDLLQSDYKHENFYYNFPRAYTLSVLECLAGMHANAIIFEEKTGKRIETHYRQIVKDNSLRGNTWISTGLKAVLKVASIHPTYQTPLYQDFIAEKLPGKLQKLYEIAETSKKFYNTLCHRDLWEKNIMFKRVDNKIISIFVDYQIACYIPPAFDVLFFIYLNTDMENRNANMQNYLEHYFKCLQDFSAQQNVDIEKILSWSDFEKSCDYLKEIALILACVYAPISYLPDGYLGAINHENPEEFMKIMNVDRDDFTVECISKFKEYGKRVLSIVEETVDFLWERL